MTPRLAIKWLRADGTPTHGGTGVWHLPVDDHPGEWMPPVTSVVPCESGYHACTPEQALNWFHESAWLVELRGEVIDHGGKLVAEQARLIRRLDWDEQSARLFACDCAERVLPTFEAAHPDDGGPREAIRVARLFVAGEATPSELAAVADAAWDAAWDAARAAARDAADAAWATAWAAAWAAARTAARAAARAAVWDAERRWQAERLIDVLGAHELVMGSRAGQHTLRTGGGQSSSRGATTAPGGRLVGMGAWE